MVNEKDREDLLFEYNSRMEDIQYHKEDCIRRKRELEDSELDFQNTAIEIDRILSDIRLKNSDDKEFIHNFDMNLSELEHAKYETHVSFSSMYENYLEEEREYSYMEEECINEYRSILEQENII